MIGPVHRSNYARRQQYRRLTRTGEAAASSGVAALVALWAANAGGTLLPLGLLIVATALGARHWISLARRSRIAADSEDAVQATLALLKAEGWRLRHALPWRGRGDIDSVAIAPTGIAIVIETKDQNVRNAPPCASARTGSVAVAAPTEMGAPRRAGRGVPCPGARRRARRR